MLSEKPLEKYRARYCEALKCTNKANWCPIFQLFTKKGGQPQMFQIAFGICNRHKDIVEPEDLLTEEFWEAYCEASEEAGVGRPVRSLTKLVWASLSPGESFYPNGEPRFPDGYEDV